MLSKFKKKTIEIDELKKVYSIYEHKKIVEIINDLINKNKLQPIKNSKMTNNYPQIYEKYRIIQIKENNEEVISELNKLYLSLSTSFYKKNINLYIRDRYIIKILSDYLLNSHNSLKDKISVNERSYEIFSDEKFLMSDIGKEILSNLCIDLHNDLNVYATPEPFCYVSLSKSTPQNILITENKDTFVTLMKLINTGNKFIFGLNIGTIIYGEGYKIKSSFDYIYEDITINYLSNPNNNILYWGDIDREGFVIYNSFKSKYINLNIKLFENAYKTMVNKSKKINLTKIKNNQKEKYKDYIDELDDDIKQEIVSIIDEGNYIPQEILNSKDIL